MQHSSVCVFLCMSFPCEVVTYSVAEAIVYVQLSSCRIQDYYVLT